VLDPNRDRTARHVVGYCLALLPVSMIQSALGWASGLYLLVAAVLGVGFVTCAVGFLHTRSVIQARRVLRMSLVYLPVLLAVLLVEGLFRSWAGSERE
jgi:protoheme IX farnesyltransferase